MQDFNYNTPTPGKLMKLLWRAAGADAYILEQATYSDQIKYFCLGGIVTATGFMASMAGGYAFYTIFEPRGSALEYIDYPIVTLLSIAFGIAWGLIIYNIDRFIVSSSGKGDGTEAITRQEIINALPRILMGTIIAITISKPLEIRMFKTEIDVELHQAQLEKQSEYMERIDSIYADRINAETGKIEKWEDEIEQKTIRAQELENQFIEEARIITVGPRALAVKVQADKAKEEEVYLKRKYEPFIKESIQKLKQIEKEKQNAIQSGENISSGLDGLLERIKLAHKIAGSAITTFITLLFLAIELAPIFFKLMMIKSPYDYLEDNIKEMMKAKKGIYVEYNHFKDRQGTERDLVRHLNVEKQNMEYTQLLETQKRLTEYAISKYEEEMKKKIDENPSAFISVAEPKA
jgi:hypothetical protein